MRPNLLSSLSFPRLLLCLPFLFSLFTLSCYVCHPHRVTIHVPQPPAVCHFPATHTHLAKTAGVPCATATPPFSGTSEPAAGTAVRHLPSSTLRQPSSLGSQHCHRRRRPRLHHYVAHPLAAAGPPLPAVRSPFVTSHAHHDRSSAVCNCRCRCTLPASDASRAAQPPLEAAVSPYDPGSFTAALCCGLFRPFCSSPWDPAAVPAASTLATFLY